MELVEQWFSCPTCGARISVLLDPSVGHQVYVEDCEVCCNPMQITCSFSTNELTDFEVKIIEQ